MEKKKILYVSANGYIGGAEKFLLNMIAYHKKTDLYDIEVLFFNDGELVEQMKTLGVKCIVLQNKFRLSKFGSLYRAIKEIRSLLIERDYHIIHNTMPYVHIVISMALYGVNTDMKKVWFQHGPVGGRLDKIAALCTTDLLIFNSQFIKNQHHKSIKYSLPAEQEVTIKLGVENRDIDDERVKSIKDFFGEKKYIVSAGRICPSKGQDLLIDALIDLKKQREDILEGLCVLIIGSAKLDRDKEYEKSLKYLVKENGLDDLVKFTGHVNDLENYLQLADAFIHTCRIPEAFGLVVAEAMQRDTLVIGSQLGGIGDILKNRETGLSYDTTKSDAHESLRDLLFEFLVDEDKFKPQRIAGQNLILEKYNLNQMGEALELEYKKLLEKNN